tara:strand:+ start:1766 stop:2080 length:315 start_codon:yes stop_codon:yes gene_type:complete
MIIKYVLNGDGTIPDYVEDGGYFIDPNDVTVARIGTAVSGGIPSDAPATTVSISKSDLINRVQGLIDEPPQGSPPIAYGPDGEILPPETATEIVDAWCIQVGEV